jgi:hypothetical protein
MAEPARGRSAALLLVLAAAGCFLSVPLDLGAGNYRAAALSIFLGTALLSLLPRAKPRRI